MALYWPEHKVALDIVDDPDRRPFAGDDGYTVIKATTAELRDPALRERVMARLRALLKTDEGTLSCVPLPNDSLGGSGVTDPLDDPVEIVACSEEEGEMMARSVQMRGSVVKSVSVWTGPVPPDSFTYYAPGVRMSTAEYFFLRKANQLTLPEAVRLGNELCGKFRSGVTEGCAPVDDYTFLRVPRTDTDYIGNYLSKVADTEEGKRALEVLGLVVDGAASPMASYLHIMLTLPPAHGGYGLGHPSASRVFRARDSLMPDASGAYLAYDLCWERERVALQYTGDTLPCARDLEALEAHGMRVVCVTDDEIANPSAMDAVAGSLAGLLGLGLPERTEDWLRARSKLRETIEVPPYAHMRSVYSDISRHV